MSLYLDASVLVALFTDDRFSGRADQTLRGKESIIVVSDFAAAEFASVIARDVRTGELTQDEARDVFSDLDNWIMQISPRAETTSSDVRTAETVLRRLDLNLRAPDALNISIAQRLNAELATFDERMAECARALGVRVAAI